MFEVFEKSLQNDKGKAFFKETQQLI